MAAKREHGQGYNSWEANTVRTADAIGGSLKSVWDHMNLKMGSMVGLGLGAAVTFGSLLVSIVEDGNKNQPIGGVEASLSAPMDYDLSGDERSGISYSYSNNFADSSFFLAYDEERFELYTWNESTSALELVDYRAADILIDQQVEYYTAYLNDQTEDWTIHRACNIIKQPFQQEDGGITRYLNGCGGIDSDKDDIAIKDVELWRMASEQMTEANYGPAPETITYFEASDRSHFESKGDILLGNMLVAFGGWAAFGAVGAGLSGVRRRAEKKISLDR
jgi:hypothetical protein